MRLVVACLLVSLLSGAGAGYASSTNIETTGNILMLDRRNTTNPIKFFAGPDLDHGVYLFVQERPEGLWAGLETFVRPAAGAAGNGYGALPLRLGGTNIWADPDGTLVAHYIVTDRIYLQSPRHTPSGAATYDQTDLGSYIARHGNDIIIFSAGQEVARFGNP